MKLLDTLVEEHALIDRVLGAFRAYVGGLGDGAADRADGTRFMVFFSEFAGHFHHDREERVLFDALVRHVELPSDRGPVHALVREHAEMAQWLREMTPLIEHGPRSARALARLQTLATRYSQALWRHIDAENSVLYPEGRERLVRCGIHELPDRQMNDVEAAARAHGAALLARYRPIDDAELVRGDGCFMCRAYGDRCNGLEAEWWTELEWEEFHNRDASD